MRVRGTVSERARGGAGVRRKGEKGGEASREWKRHWGSGTKGNDKSRRDGGETVERRRSSVRRVRTRTCTVRGYTPKRRHAEARPERESVAATVVDVASPRRFRAPVRKTGEAKVERTTARGARPRRRSRCAALVNRRARVSPSSSSVPRSGLAGEWRRTRRWTRITQVSTRKSERKVHGNVREGQSETTDRWNGMAGGGSRSPVLSGVQRGTRAFRSHVNGCRCQ